MKTQMLTFVLLLIISACKNDKKEDVISEKSAENETSKKTVLYEECYQYSNGKDTINLSFKKENDKIEGQLSYHFFEKDDNYGTINGKIKGDTIFANYTFASEGIQSVREVVFLKKNSTYTEGYAPIEEVNGKTVYKDLSLLNFNNSFIMNKTDCKQHIKN